jgi:hypothetical protein
MNQGNRPEDIFRGDADRELFLAALEAIGRMEKELSRRAKDDKGKVRLARQLRAETTMTLGWIVAGYGWAAGPMCQTCYVKNLKHSFVSIVRTDTCLKGMANS